MIPNVTIHSVLSGGESSLANGPLKQKTESYHCTTLKFRITSLQSSEQLILYADGPCKDAYLSVKNVSIYFQKCLCPSCFQPNVASINSTVSVFVIHDSVISLMIAILKTKQL